MFIGLGGGVIKEEIFWLELFEFLLDLDREFFSLLLEFIDFVEWRVFLIDCKYEEIWFGLSINFKFLYWLSCVIRVWLGMVWVCMVIGVVFISVVKVLFLDMFWIMLLDFIFRMSFFSVLLFICVELLKSFWIFIEFFSIGFKLNGVFFIIICDM